MPNTLGWDRLSFSSLLKGFPQQQTTLLLLFSCGLVVKAAGVSKSDDVECCKVALDEGEQREASGKLQLLKHVWKEQKSLAEYEPTKIQTCQAIFANVAGWEGLAETVEQEQKIIVGRMVEWCGEAPMAGIIASFVTKAEEIRTEQVRGLSERLEKRGEETREADQVCKAWKTNMKASASFKEIALLARRREVTGSG